MKLPILYEDKILLVVDKPAGVVVTRAESVKGEIVQDWAENYLKTYVGNFQTENSDFVRRGGVVHRLDKETSGCLIIAKNGTSFAKLQIAFKNRLVKKTYIALVHRGLFGRGEIKAPVARLPWNRERFGIVPGGKEAVTKYQGIKVFVLGKKDKDPKSFSSSQKQESIQINNPSKLRMMIKGNRRLSPESIYTLLELQPESGRTHQLRVHLKYINHPIVGDYLYAGRKLQRQDRQWCPRVFLHAAKIEFPHPETGEFIKIESPLPEQLHQVLSQLHPL